MFGPPQNCKMYGMIGNSRRQSSWVNHKCVEEYCSSRARLRAAFQILSWGWFSRIAVTASTAIMLTQ